MLVHYIYIIYKPGELQIIRHKNNLHNLTLTPKEHFIQQFTIYFSSCPVLYSFCSANTHRFSNVALKHWSKALNISKLLFQYTC